VYSKVLRGFRVDLPSLPLFWFFYGFWVFLRFGVFGVFLCDFGVFVVFWVFSEVFGVGIIRNFGNFEVYSRFCWVFSVFLMDFWVFWLILRIWVFCGYLVFVCFPRILRCLGLV